MNPIDLWPSVVRAFAHELARELGPVLTEVLHGAERAHPERPRDDAGEAYLSVGETSQKVRLIVDLVRGRQADDALNMLNFMPNAAAKPVAKVLRTAIANAEENFGLNRNDLMVTQAFADEGPTRK